MSFLRDMAIKHKLVSLIMLTCITALLLAGIAFISCEWATIRHAMAQNLSTQAAIIADNCKAALTFDDAKDAEEVLKALHVNSSVVFGGVYDSSGELFASYYRDDTDSNVPPPELKTDSYSFAGGFLMVCKPVVLDKEIIGTVCLRSGLHPMYVRLKHNSIITIVTLLICSLAAYLVSSRLQKIISGPILSLAEVARAVSEQKDYSTRALKQTNDEMGLLIDAFNEMLEQIQHRDLELETRVAERTTELSIANDQLTREIAERKRTEETLAEERNLLRTLIDNLPDCHIFVKDTGSRFVTTNAAHLRTLGAETLEEVVGKTDYVLFPGELAKQYYADEQTIIRSGQPLVNREELVLDHAGNRKWFLTTKVPLQDNQGRVTGLVGMSQDITELKLIKLKLEQIVLELKRSNDDLQQFASVASHDLQEPLRMITSYLQLLVKHYKDKLDTDANEFIDFAVDGAKRMQGLINDLLAYSRVGTRGKEFKSCNFEDILTKVLIDLSIIIEENDAVVTRDPLPTLAVDATQLEQVFRNLISNAIKYRRKDERPQIHISAKPKDNEWLFSVKDNGVGIKPEFFERVFVIFQRLHSRTEYSGSGLGLAICKRIVERHGGRIWIESEPEKGSIFYFTIPVKKQSVLEAKGMIDTQEPETVGSIREIEGLT